jgi:hypothetical protein
MKQLRWEMFTGYLLPIPDGRSSTAVQEEVRRAGLRRWEETCIRHVWSIKRRILQEVDTANETNTGVEI